MTNEWDEQAEIPRLQGKPAWANETDHDRKHIERVQYYMVSPELRPGPKLLFWHLLGLFSACLFLTGIAQSARQPRDAPPEASGGY